MSDDKLKLDLNFNQDNNFSLDDIQKKDVNEIPDALSEALDDLLDEKSSKQAAGKTDLLEEIINKTDTGLDNFSLPELENDSVAQEIPNTNIEMTDESGADTLSTLNEAVASTPAIYDDLSDEARAVLENNLTDSALLTQQDEKTIAEVDVSDLTEEMSSDWSEIHANEVENLDTIEAEAEDFTTIDDELMEIDEISIESEDESDLDDTVINEPELTRLSVKMKTQEEAYNCFMPFLKHLGVFIPTQATIKLGSRVEVEIFLPNDKKEIVRGEVCWVTPTGQASRPEGVGVHFYPEFASVGGQIQALVATKLNSGETTHTM